MSEYMRTIPMMRMRCPKRWANLRALVEAQLRKVQCPYRISICDVPDDEIPTLVLGLIRLDAQINNEIILTIGDYIEGSISDAHIIACSMRLARKLSKSVNEKLAKPAAQ